MATTMRLTGIARTSLKCYNYPDPDDHQNHDHYCIGEGESTYEDYDPSVEELQDHLGGSWRVEPVTTAYVVEWEWCQESAVVLVTLDKEQADKYAEDENSDPRKWSGMTYRVTSWTLGVPDNDL
jgi:hypothetical protein